MFYNIAHAAIDSGNFDTYIGRKFGGYEESIWANPVSVKSLSVKLGFSADQHNIVVEMYRYRFYRMMKTGEVSMKDFRKHIQGKRLGCWCNPVDDYKKSCHGMILRDYEFAIKKAGRKQNRSLMVSLKIFRASHYEIRNSNGECLEVINKLRDLRPASYYVNMYGTEVTLILVRNMKYKSEDYLTTPVSYTKTENGLFGDISQWWDHPDYCPTLKGLM